MFFTEKDLHASVLYEIAFYNNLTYRSPISA